MKFFRKKNKRRDDDGPDATAYNHFAGGNGYGDTFASAPNGTARHSVFPSTFRKSTPHGRDDAGGGPGTAAAAARSRASQFRPMATRASAIALTNLPGPVLERVFAFVCPHASDNSYETCEQSAIEDACMLCDLRDLAHCVAVCRRWRREAVKLLYHSIRIDTVHYCEREIYLSDLRKRGSFFDRNAEPEDTAQARLKLLCRTLREDPVRLGPLVFFLKTPYMLRESCQADLARTIAVLPNLRYVDLPEGLFMDDPAFLTLRLEVQARCHDLRKMTYMAGAERSLQTLASGQIWTKLEVLELIRINMDPALLRQVLACLAGSLRALKISDSKSFNDEAFVLRADGMMPPFPPLDELILTNVPNVTSHGLTQWLLLPETQRALNVLTLNGTGVKPWTLHAILASAPALKHLSVIDSVTTPMPMAGSGLPQPPLLASQSLVTLHFEITSPASFSSSTTTSSYYAYLAASLLAGNLPGLRAVYVRDPDFPDALLGLPPPMPSFADGALPHRPASSGSSSGGFPSARFSGAPVSPQYFLSPGPSPPPPLSAGSGSHQQYPNPFLSPHSPRTPVSTSTGGSGLASNNPFAAFTTGSTAPAAGAAFGGIAALPPLLEVFTKPAGADGDADLIDWSFVKVETGAALPSARQRAGETPARPSSAYGLGADVMGGAAGAAGWSSGAGGARRSVLVGGAGGGFLEVPGVGGSGARGGRRRGGSSGAGVGFGGAGGGGGYGAGDGGEGQDLWPRPQSSAGESKRERMDLWR